MVKRLFQNLAQRWRNENALSDMTWAMAETSSTFRDILIQFFRFDVSPVYPVSVEREQTIDTGRPDFKITNGERFFMIENKIYDRNYHIESYCDTKETGYEGLGLITNHVLDSQAQQVASRNKVACRTWLEFKQRLEQQMNEFPDEERACIQAYLTYVQGVCDMVDLQKIDFTGLQSLYHFHVLLQQVLEGLNHPRVRLEYYRPGYANCCFGDYYKVSMESEETRYYPWVGVYFKEKDPTVYFAFRKDWDPGVYERWKGRREDRPMMRIMDMNTEQEIQFILKDAELARFSKAILEEQQQLLAQFARAVVEEVFPLQERSYSPNA